MALVYRTFSPKVSQYMPDGGGRDTYISNNNGGAFHSSSPVRDNPNSPRVYSGFYSPKKPRLEAKPFRYRSDGTGRDSYVVCVSLRVNHGGLYQEDRKYKAFHQTLREFPEVSMIRTSGTWLTEAARKQLGQLQSTQREQSLRLSKTFKTNSLNSSHIEKPRRLSPIPVEPKAE